MTASPFNLDPQEKLSLGENIAHHIQSLLHQGKLRPGDTLPTQRELAQQYGTSVSAVREAISILSAAGLVDARPGRGTLILEAAEQPPSVNLWLGAVTSEQQALDFLETRQALEHYTIAQAAQGASPDDQQELRE
ncbi:FadR/GntR family transcriptional regulator, partial [Deinococcus sonorensis]